MDEKSFRIISIVGIVVMLVGGSWLGFNIKSFWGMERVEGRVVKNLPSQAGLEETSIAETSQVEYVVEGKVLSVEVNTRYGKRGAGLRKIGDSISIAYNPNNPSDAKEFNVVLAYVIPGLLMFSGLTTVLIFSWLRDQVAAQATRPTAVS